MLLPAALRLRSSSLRTDWAGLSSSCDAPSAGKPSSTGSVRMNLSRSASDPGSGEAGGSVAGLEPVPPATGLSLWRVGIATYPESAFQTQSNAVENRHRDQHAQ